MKPCRTLRKGLQRIRRRLWPFRFKLLQDRYAIKSGYEGFNRTWFNVIPTDVQKVVKNPVAAN
jgi:hypothetical protein